MDKKQKIKKKLKLSTSKTKTCPSNPHFICDKEVVIQLERLSDSVVAEMTASGSALTPEQTKKRIKLSTPKTKSCRSNAHFICDKEVVIQLERLSDSVVAEMTASGSALPPEQIMASNNEALNINSLPEEMLTNVFSHLSQNELGRIARVCRRWNVLTKVPVFWKEVDVEFHWSHKAQNTVTMSFVEMLPPCVTRIRLDFRHFGFWTGRLNWEEFCVKLQRCPRLKMLVLKGALLSDSLPSVIDFCTVLQDVKILNFHRSSFTDCLPREEFGVTSKIEVLDLTLSFLGYSNVSPFSKMPQLKQLWLYDTNVKDSWFEDDISFLNQLQVLNVGYMLSTSKLFSVIRDNGINLKELFCCDMFVLDQELNFNNSVFPHLKTICLMRVSTVTCEGVVSLIQSCQSLENVYVDEDVAASYAAHPFIVANKCKLEIVKFIRDCDKHRRFAC